MIKHFLNFLFPSACITCQREGDFLCADCNRTLVFKPIKSGYQNNRTDFKHLDGVIYALDYAKNPHIQAAIKQFKYKFTRELAEDFASHLSRKLDELHMTRGQQLSLIPIPLHKNRRRERGFNQAEVLAKALQNLRDDIQLTPLLRRVRKTKQQARLSKEERHQNLKGAFELDLATEKLDPNSIIFLVDDVCTTGATLEAAAKTLKESGFQKVYGLVIARAFK